MVLSSWNIEDKNEIIKFDAKSRKAVATWPLEGCDSPSGMAIDRAGHRLFSPIVRRWKDGHHQLRDWKIAGTRIDWSVLPMLQEFDPKHGVAFSSNGGDGTLTVVDAAKPGLPYASDLEYGEGCADDGTLDA